MSGACWNADASAVAATGGIDGHGDAFRSKERRLGDALTMEGMHVRIARLRDFFAADPSNSELACELADAMFVAGQSEQADAFLASLAPEVATAAGVRFRMAHGALLLRGRLASGDVHAAVHLAGVGADHLDRQAPGERHGHSRLADAGGPGDDEQRRATHGHHVQCTPGFTSRALPVSA